MGFHEIMTKTAWKNRIVKCCRDAGTFQPCFSDSIDTLAWILAQRDDLVRQFEDSGGNGVVEHTNKSGATNFEQNPLLRMINDYNRDALTYWRDLGLTPKGLRAISEDAMKPVKVDALAEALKGMGL